MWSNLISGSFVPVSQPWGYPSAPITISETPSGNKIAFLARHGKGHAISPSEVPVRANIAALKHIGVRVILAFSAVGSLRLEMKPRDFVLPDQIIDRTKGIRPSTFFEDGVVAHCSFSHPFDEKLAKLIYEHGANSLKGENAKVHLGGTLIVMEVGLRDQLQASEVISRCRLGTGTCLLDARGIQHVPLLGRLHHQHVRSPRVEAGQGSRDSLPDDLHVHGL